MWSTVTLIFTGGFLGNVASKSRAEPRVGNMLIQWQRHKVTSSDFVTGLRIGRSPSLVLKMFHCCKGERIKEKCPGLRTELQCRTLGLQSSAGTHFSLLLIPSLTSSLVFNPFPL